MKFAPSQGWAYASDIANEALKYFFNFGFRLGHYETDLVGNSCAIDNGVQFGDFNQGYLYSKARKFRNMPFRINSRDYLSKFSSEGFFEPSVFSEHFSNAEYDSVFSPVRIYGGHLPEEAEFAALDRTLALEFLYQLKSFYLLLMRNFYTGEKGMQERVDRKEHWELSDYLSQFFGSDSSMVVYGSATYPNSVNNDWDVIVIPEKFELEHYRTLANNKLEWNGKPVGVVLVDRESWPAFLTFNGFALGILKYGIVIQGDPVFPRVDVSEVLVRSLSRSVGSRIGGLSGTALNWAFMDPQKVFSMPDYLQSLTKVPRYALMGMIPYLNSLSGKPYVHKTNAEWDRMLSKLFSNNRRFGNVAEMQRSLLELFVDTEKVLESFWPWRMGLDGKVVQNRAVWDLKPSRQMKLDFEYT
jgi:hypothetical protein